MAKKRGTSLMDVPLGKQMSSVDGTKACFITSVGDQKPNTNWPICLPMLLEFSFKLQLSKKVNNQIGKFGLGFLDFLIATSQKSKPPNW